MGGTPSVTPNVAERLLSATVARRSPVISPRYRETMTSNRLAQETSPYLRQHRENPVDWFAWGPAAFAAATERNVPILLSVGYSACHWCHVMAHECFEDTAVADRMNALFVNVKVDREERPDVDAVYMDAVQAMTGRGGWPMTVFLTPSGAPFYGGTYFPKPQFLQLLASIDDVWRTRPGDVQQNVTAMSEALSRSANVQPVAEYPGPDLVDLGLSQLAGQFDAEWGGFGGAPKFPSTMSLDLLARSFAISADDAARTILTTSLDAMASGGMYDHIGGGFARYSVDAQWLVPHFEKMLYDQALLAGVYLHASLVFDKPEWRQVVAETTSYVLSELRHEDGGFFSAEDADSLDDYGHSHEGHFYVWSEAEIAEVVPAEILPATLAWYEITGHGNFEGRNIPARLNHRGNLLRSPDVERARALLYAARTSRARPGLDNKIITEWNGLMLSSLAQAAAAYRRADWLEAASKNGEFLWRELRDDHGRWMRSWQQDGSPRARHTALACDLAAVVDAFTRLGEASGMSVWFARARETADQLLDHFWDATNGGLFTTPDDGEQLIVRQKDLLDNATPSANSSAALALYRLGALTGESRYERIADQILLLLGHVAKSAPSAFGHLLAAVHLRNVGVTEIVVAGERPDLVDFVQKHWLPTAVIAWGEPFDSPLWQDRTGDRAYVCRKYACQVPSSTIDELTESLRLALN